VITAAAAIGRGKLSPESIISFNGMNHTLYRKNVFDPRVTRWTRFMTVREAFAKSVNTVFARIGALFIGPGDLRQTAESFGFNRKIASDLPTEISHAAITEDKWQIAEAASGYTQENTMSPLQGALIAAAVVNDGTMMEPYIVDAVLTDTGNSIYSARPQVAGVPMSSATAGQIRRLMQETVAHGTARGAFKRFFHNGQEVEVGGKTGSLTGTSPEGKYDWFVGYAKNGTQRIAFAALTINKKFWKVKSAYLARRAIESYFAKDEQVSLLHDGVRGTRRF
jgi:cell division protein FtsI/penicillin-binding protein 2